MPKYQDTQSADIKPLKLRLTNVSDKVEIYLHYSTHSIMIFYLFSLRKIYFLKKSIMDNEKRGSKRNNNTYIVTGQVFTLNSLSLLNQNKNNTIQQFKKFYIKH